MYKKVILPTIGALLAMTIGAAGAYFTAQVQVADSMIKAGSVAVSTEPTTAPLSVDALGPGTTAIRPFTVRNSGTLASDVIVTAAKKAGITEFYEALTCRVTCDGSLLYDGSLSGLRTAPLRLSPGESANMRFEIGMPATAGNTLACDYAKVSLYVDAEQAH